MAQNSNDKLNDVNFLQQAMTAELKREIGYRFEEIKKAAVAQLDRDKDQIIAGIALHIEKQMSFERMGQTIVITLKTEPVKN